MHPSKTDNVFENELAEVALVDQTTDYHFVRAFRANSRPFAYCERAEGWLQSKRPIDPGRGAVRLDLDTRVHLAHCAAYEPLHQTSSANAHCSDTVDGSNLCVERSKYILFN